MRIISNDRMISRNAKIGTWASILGLAALVGATYIAFRYIEMILVSLILMAVGFLISQVGIFFSNRWGRRPRPDELLSKALKGLDNSYTLYHYQTPAGHLLVGPPGVWVLNPNNTRGEISYNEQKERWKQKGGNLYFKLFAQEGLGRPDLEIDSEVRAVERVIEKNWEGEKQPPVQAALVLTTDGTEVNASNAPIPTLHLRKLKDFIRRQSKEGRLSKKQIQQVNRVFGAEELMS